MKKQTEIAKAAVKQHDPQTFASSISNIALRGKNMVKVAKREADNSEDPEFKQKVDIASDKLTDCKLNAPSITIFIIDGLLKLNL